jgi:hypothetical protein
MQKVEGFEPLQPLSEKPSKSGVLAPAPLNTGRTGIA